MNILITICARGGSKGIPNKNIKPINGLPLLHYTLKLAYIFANEYSSDIQLSTDSFKILKSAEELGYRTDYIRPSKLATDSSGKIDTIYDAWKYSETVNKKVYDYILDLDVSSPLRNLTDLINGFNKISANYNALNLVSVNPASRNPYFNMVEEKGDGFVKIVKESGILKSRQEAPIVYDMNASFYFYRRKFFDSNWKTSITDQTIIYTIPHICFDLDDPIDFIIMEMLLQNDKLDFVL